MCLSHKPSLVFIAEPMISQSALRDSFWAALNLKFFALNNRGDLFPSLWGLCSVDLFPVVLASSDQHFSFSLCLANKTFNVAVIYAHTNYIRRRDPWSQAAFNFLSFPGPWCIIGDFNAITGAHECSSSFLPNSTACSDFVNFIQSSNLKDLRTWNKSTFGNIHHAVNIALQYLETIQNEINLDSDNDDLLAQENLAQKQLLNALNLEEIFWKDKARVNWHTHGDRNTSYFHKLTRIREATKAISMIRHDDNIITDPYAISSHIVHFYMNLCNSSNDIQHNHLINSVIPSLVTEVQNNLLTTIPSNEDIKSSVFALSGDSAPGPDGFSGCFYHAFWDIIHLDVCNSGADRVEDFRPIALANFQFKIITKLIADRLASITPNIISSQQRGFIKGRKIQDCIYLASEAINLLPHKVFGGNLAIKLDIKKAFDTIDWTFLLDTLKAFGFNQVFCSWINAILHSARLSININGSQVGFFNCSRGVRQGDPLSPLLFCIAEDVLSRGITSLVLVNKLSSISGPRNLQTPSHVLYADDIIIFCKATSTQLLNLKNLVLDYSKASGQIINLPKCNFFSAATSTRKIARIASTLGFSVGYIPFSYLGVPILYGKPRRVHLQAIADRILSKLANWKGASLSIMGRVEIVKNFIWSGSIAQKKICTVAWSKMCSPISEGGLGLRSLRQMNRAALLKLAWDMRISSHEWACFYRERFGCHWTHSSRYFKSSIWPRIRDNWSLTSENAIWLVGDGHQVNFWLDNWIEEPIVDLMNIPLLLQASLKATCASFIDGNHWLIPKLIKDSFPSICSKIAATKIVDHDQLIWKASADGSLSMKMAYSTFSHNHNSLSWSKLIWTDFIPPSKSFLVWRLIHARLPTDENLMIRGCAMASVCSLCFKHTEDSTHLFLNCIYATSLWNQRIFENASTPLHLAINAIKRDTSLSGASAKASSSAHTVKDLIILRSLDIALNINKAPVIIEVIWRTPRVGWVKANSDGAAHGSPGISGSGGLFRDHMGSFMLAFSNYTSIQSAIFAELHGAMHAVAIAANRDWCNLWLECDSTLVIDIFNGTSLPPWQLLPLWLKCKNDMLSFNFRISHIYREGNQCADLLANHGLHSRTNIIWSTIPYFIVNKCNRNALCLPNYRFKND
ncbi:PREDICTED: uncharacterized protein LOC109332502 [Lupinus angustifolius]|uniref:uncharacterized protein LOC109332502 n=1 Tax=Lupinus angustifolius TaxID=3871 RepID=UPI00092F3930|nr:PREDICTED: uncharacterized protein LOC109332502 [Lupinus angustifolius]